MGIYTLRREQQIGMPRGGVFEFFSRPENLEEITPPWLKFRILEVPGEIRTGSLIHYSLRWGVVPLHWTTEITEWNPPHSFVDTQIAGPYKLWRHRHEFEEREGGTLVRDTVSYELRMGVLGRLAHGVVVRRNLDAIFDYRQTRICERFAGAGRE